MPTHPLRTQFTDGVSSCAIDTPKRLLPAPSAQRSLWAGRQPAVAAALLALLGLGCEAGLTTPVVPSDAGNVVLPDAGGGVMTDVADTSTRNPDAEPLADVAPIEDAAVPDDALDSAGLEDVAVADTQPGACQGATDGTGCDDGDPCTETVCQAGACVVVKTTCGCSSNADCPDDGDLCNGVPYCDLQQAIPSCKLDPASVVNCPQPANSCEEALCSPTSGSCLVLPKPGSPACDDGNPCTANDACVSGQCVGGANTCGCNTDADCAGSEDGNLCNGTLICDKTSSQCVVNPASVVTCAPDSVGSCVTTTCQPATGKCVANPVTNGTACDDKNACTKGDACDAGVCVPGNNTCGCSSNADCASQEDGNACNGTLYCDLATGACKPKPNSAVVCPASANPCASNVCEPSSGKCLVQPLPDNSQCDDGDACTAPGVCKAGTCQNGGNVCGCQTNQDCAKFDDTNLCNGSLVCNTASGDCEVNPATVVTCPTSDDTLCVKNLCVPELGLCALTTVASGPECGPVKRKFGEACDPDFICGSFANATTQAEVDAIIQCQDSQCETGDCLLDFCVKACTIPAGGDVKNNATGQPGADGVLDGNTDAGCEGAVSGPRGDSFRCTLTYGNLNNPEGALCQPGTTLAPCESSFDCTEGEVCADFYMLGSWQSRCTTKVKQFSGEPGATVGAACNLNPSQGPVVECENWMCVLNGGKVCSAHCATDEDCPTGYTCYFNPQYYGEGQGANICVAGTPPAPTCVEEKCAIELTSCQQQPECLGYDDYLRLAQCVQDSGCTTNECLSTSCKTEVDNCSASTCIDIVGCVNACADADQACLEACVLEAPGSDTYAALSQCFEANCEQGTDQPVCGDGSCEAPETATVCPDDCGEPSGDQSCADSCEDGDNGGCYCSSDCAEYGDCCSDYTLFCSASPVPDTCADSCTDGDNGSCYCSLDCVEFGDCCSDYEQYCGAP